MNRLVRKLANKVNWLVAAGFALAAGGLFLNHAANAQASKTATLIITTRSVPAAAKAVHISCGRRARVSLFAQPATAFMMWPPSQAASGKPAFANKAVIPRLARFP